MSDVGTVSTPINLTRDGTLRRSGESQLHSYILQTLYQNTFCIHANKIFSVDISCHDSLRTYVKNKWARTEHVDP